MHRLATWLLHYVPTVHIQDSRETAGPKMNRIILWFQNLSGGFLLSPNTIRGLGKLRRNTKIKSKANSSFVCKNWSLCLCLSLLTMSYAIQQTTVLMGSLPSHPPDDNHRFNPLEFTGNYSVTSKKIWVGTLAVDGWLLHLAQRGGAWAGCGPSLLYQM